MASLQTTELKLKSTPTGGVDASHSPYYRRLLSAGYKGFLQGSIGGAGLYGAFGLVIGSLTAIAALPFLSLGAALAIIPTGAAIGMLKGATTFGQIGSTAAINAEGADLSEQRRYLLDRYYDLPEGPEGDREAEAIRQELLARQNDAQKAPPFMHWKTVCIGAVLGAAIVLGGLAYAGFLGSPAAFATVIAKTLGISIGTPLMASIGALTAAGLTSIGAAAGAFTGATIGIDRYYIRKWFDHTEGVVHSGSHKDYGLMERHEQVQRLKQAAQEDEKTKQHLAAAIDAAPAVQESVPKEPTAATPAPKPVASLDAAPAPSPKVNASSATLQRRVAELHAAHVLEM